MYLNKEKCYLCNQIKRKAMKLVVMTQPVFFVEEDKILTSLFDEGMDCLHLSKPNSSPVYHERLLSLLPEEIHRRITVHEHYYLKNEYQLYSIHINDAETPLPQGYKGRFSRSCAEIERLREAKKKAEYVLLEQDFEEAARRGLIDKHVYDARENSHGEGIGIRRSRHLQRPVEPFRHPQPV